ncbi:helix-turn-helix transcriptional regulator [Phytoactinopolyspora limicola]|uniref:helix-turn-helix transcriptional regulator n=1 Tax=Phytoactinopolyspora limicola TaxID=2715536 RepID=UPI00140CEBFE|nr:helix-turn-helix transcriptional regulator [Phytoactinopolyspora limicola]
MAAARKGKDLHDRAATGELAAHVRRRRKHLGLRQGELADLAGCSERFIHMLEAGKPTVRLDKVLDVLRVLGLHLEVQRGVAEGITVDEA